MLFMAVFTYEPQDRDQVIKRRLDDLGVAELIPVVETEFALKVLKRVSRS
jgi:hypothetical protein